MLENKKFGLISLGCDKNRVDAERLLGEIKSRGYAVTDEMEDANILIVNTCAFLQSAREEALDTVLECNALRGKNLEKIVVSGCLPEKYVAELFPALTEADVFLGCSDSDKLLESLERSYSEGRINAVGQGKESAAERVLTTPAHYAYLKIADGCDNFCTYCLIPKIRGRYRSEPMEKLVEEAQGLGDVSELILVAQDTTRYGEDLYGTYALDALLRELSAVDGIRWLRLLYCYPGRITDGLVEEIASNPKVVKYIDMPIQHISDRVLRAMNRRDTAADIRSAVERLRSAVPDIVLRTTVITGFPGETEDEFEELRAFLRETRFERLGVFAYSREEGTPAYDLPDQIPEKLKRKRYDALMREQRKIHTAYNRAQVGKTLAVVCEGYDTVSESYYGRSYADAPDIDGRVFFSAPRRVREGELVRVEVSEVLDYDLVGKFIGEGEPQ